MAIIEPKRIFKPKEIKKSIVKPTSKTKVLEGSRKVLYLDLLKRYERVPNVLKLILAKLNKLSSPVIEKLLKVKYYQRNYLLESFEPSDLELFVPNMNITALNYINEFKPEVFRELKNFKNLDKIFASFSQNQLNILVQVLPVIRRKEKHFYDYFTQSEWRTMKVGLEVYIKNANQFVRVRP